MHKVCLNVITLGKNFQLKSLKVINPTIAPVPTAAAPMMTTGAAATAATAPATVAATPPATTGGTIFSPA